MEHLANLRQVVYSRGDVELIQCGHRYFVRYDAGAHQVAIREDEISETEATRIQTGTDDMNEVLFAFQKKLLAQGVDPYVSNCPNKLHS